MTDNKIKKHTDKDAIDMIKGAIVFGWIIGILVGLIIAYNLWKI